MSEEMNEEKTLFDDFEAETPEETANEILAMGLAHLIASDAHGSHSRTPHMGQLMEWAEECCDEEYAAILLEENPRRLLRGLPLIGAE